MIFMQLLNESKIITGRDGNSRTEPELILLGRLQLPMELDRSRAGCSLPIEDNLLLKKIMFNNKLLINKK
jgi:hypothetical protein